MIRAGSKVPYSNADGSQYSYLDLGVSIDCYHVTEMHDTMSLVIKADVSSIVQEPAPSSAVMRQPVVRQNQWQAGVVVPIKKPTVVFSSDDLTTKRQMQVELTATPIL
jgi:3-deoxy-D-manno-octulosonic acid (KDO) 8-phosphate synthase